MQEKHTAGRLQISTECDQECIFCSVPEGPPESPSLEEIKKRIIRLKKQGTNDLFVTGGEPAVHPEIFDILDFAKKTGFKEITIQSNCVNLTKPFLRRIKAYGIVKFNSSFHSYKKEICNKLSTKEHYRKILNGLSNIRDFEIPIFLTITINKLNYKELKNHIIFIRKHFPNITHFSFNFVDPTGRARQNKWIVPTLTETERYIHETVKYILDNNLTFRLERVPLCYMTGFEEFSTEGRRYSLDEKRLTYLAQEDKKDDRNFFIDFKSEYFKSEACQHCFLKCLCSGLNPNYVEIHGSDELYPVFTKPDEIIARVRQSKVILDHHQHEGYHIKQDNPSIKPETYNNKLELFKNKVYQDLKLFKKAIEIKPSKNNIYDTYSFFLLQRMGLKNQSLILKAWEILTDKIRRGLEPNLLTLYIHFPYCQSTCAYCVYPSTKLKDRSQIAEYISYLIEEIKRFAPLFKGLKFKALSMGGGTSSLMSVSQLKNLIEHIHKYFEFDKYAEKGIEFNPNTTNREKLNVLDKFNFNKFSIGVQSLSPRVLRLNKRGYQTIEQVKKTISDFKKTGISYLNVDLLLGLKGDTPKDFLYTFTEICKMQPSVISIYPLKTNKNYFKSIYDGDPKKFLDFYYPLFDKVTKELPKIAEKYNFSSYEDQSKLSYVHPLAFCLKKEESRNVKYVYTNFRTEPYSNLGIGYYAEGSINNILRYIYVNKNHTDGMFLKNFPTDNNEFFYLVFRFRKNYSKVKFITHSVYEKFAVSRKDYKQMYGKDIIDDFPYAIKALKFLKIISVDGDEIVFNIKDEKETYIPLMFFVGRKIVKFIVTRILRYGTDENVNKAIAEVKSSNKLELFKNKIYQDIKLFEKAIKNKPNKNNIYDTYAYFLMQGIGFKNKHFVYKAWKNFTNKVRTGIEPNLLNLYFHFPYCQSNCDYCCYPSTTLKSKQQMEEYLDYLTKEIKIFSPLFKNLKLKTLSIGGGTPSLMSEEQLKRFITIIHEHFEFEKYAEKGIEMNSITTTLEKLRVIDSFGFNKLSIGIQSLSPRVLRIIKRSYQTPENIRETISNFKKTNIGFINVDLVLGLKGDTPKDFLYTFEEVCKMKASLIAIYPLKANDEYIKKRYGTVEKFFEFYYALFDKVTKELPNIAEKQGYNSEYKDFSKLSYVHPFAFSLKKQHRNRVDYYYSNFQTKPYSTLGLGYYSESCINNMMRYIHVDKDHPSTMFLKKFSTDKKDFTNTVIRFLPNYDKVKFITHSVYEHFSVKRKEYEKMFKTDIVSDFPYAIKALEFLRIISVNEEEIIFDVKDEKETYVPLLFFVGRNNIISIFRKFDK